MRAAIVRAYGPPEVVRVEELPTPEPAEGQVLVRVRAASVNFPDVLIVRDRYQVSAPLPFVPGSELAGVVEAVGPGVGEPKPGDRVVGATFVGAFAERVVLPARSLSPVPEGVALRDAAAFLIAYGTAYHALRSVAHLRAGQTLVVLGAAGGVGLAAVDLGRALGARVIAAAGGPEKLAACREKGADAVVDYRKEDLKQRLKELTSGRGADAVIDPVGGPHAEQALRATGWRGRFVCVGFASGEIPRIPLNLLLLKGAEVAAFNMAPFGANEPDEMRRNHAELLQLWERGVVAPRISSVHPLERAARALREVADRRAIGKVLIEVAERDPEPAEFSRG